MPVFDEISISMEDIEGRPAINLRIQDILISPAVKIEPQPIHPKWVSRIGRYESIELKPCHSILSLKLTWIKTVDSLPLFKK